MRGTRKATSAAVLAISARLLICLLVIVAFSPARAVTMTTETVMIPKSRGPFSIDLETQIYAPIQPGKYPLIVLSHGKAQGNPRFQASGEFYGQALEFVKRGYVVLAPNRMGFSKSGGSYISGCNLTSMGQEWADDVAAAVDYARALPYVDATHILLVGQSQGGFVSVALGSRNLPGVVGIVNFAGGMRPDNCPGWESGLVDAYASYGKSSKVPALFMYGDNDSYFPQPLPQRIFGAYQGVGGHATLVDFGGFETDSHTMFHKEEGRSIWIPQVEKFLQQLGLPHEATVSTHVANLAGDSAEDFDALSRAASGDPGVLAGYRRFLWGSPPRAFAISPDGHFGIGWGTDAESRALANCAPHTHLTCRIYAVDENVVIGPN